ncbi:DUF808 domain-containing protein [Glutamicibacter sp. MNS18]|uniref:DUF808 domain-containing protein n=1 Tax=Glutamicibacter sp. MNS18 TaxID=2989817 RepID=UPI0022367399|nr:DUF808 domain-containing protein [Glutamicibacter sp. MNS18]MCW4466508.1 DUF808 domain-containing protein [Glutamicibacter sp. MNS18]
MAGGLVALLDDVAALVKLAAASLDDVAMGAGKAGTKALGVVVDDAAVTPQYVAGISPKRELPIVWKIALGSIRNKLLIILPLALLLSQFAPWALTPILMLGGSYLVFEGAEKILELFGILKHHDSRGGDKAVDEKTIIGAAVRTDLILSAEIMVISLNEVAHEPFWIRTAILVSVALGMTLVVYGVVAVIVRMDDVGLKLAQRTSTLARKTGRGLVKAMPVIMSILSKVGVVAMLWVGGHIILVGFDELGWHAPYALVHHLELLTAESSGSAGQVLGWLVNTALSCVAGLLIGSVVTAAVLGIRALRAREAGQEHQE